MSVTLHTGDCLDVLRGMEAQSVNCCVTSPPYFGLRDYGHDGQIGLEGSPDAYIERLVQVFREVRRVLRDDGTLWLNLGDSYAGAGRTGGGAQGERTGALSSPNGKGSWWSHRGTGLKVKDRIMIPARVALALQQDGWYLRDEIVWHKPNPMPTSVRDRTTPAHEMVYMLSKRERYFYDQEAIKEPLAATSIARLSQPNIQNQAGSNRANGGAKTNGPMKAVGPRFGGHKYGDDPRHRTKGGGEWTGGNGKRNRRSVWTVTTKPYKGAHFATFPADLIEPCVLAGAPEGGVVLDPFLGSGTTAATALRLNRAAVGIELNPEYMALAETRIAETQQAMRRAAEEAVRQPDLFQEASE